MLTKPLRILTGTAIIGLSLIFFGCQKRKSTSTEQSSPTANPKGGKNFSVMFYNVENLFDIEDDLTNDGDDEWLPTGQNEWTQNRYHKKLADLANVIGTSTGSMPAIIGLCEVENKKVIQDLIETVPLVETDFLIIHRDSPDSRGIDVALVVNPKIFLPDLYLFHRVTVPNPERPTTRDILYVRGLVDGKRLHLFVNHWPSRSSGQEQTESYRMEAAKVLKTKMDSIMAIEPDARILSMGDMNDHPNDRSITEGLRARGQQPAHYFNYMEKTAKDGYGTYFYKGQWGILDQFIGSWPLVNAESGIFARDTAARIVDEKWLLYMNDRGENMPNRTFAGKNYTGGFSDHLPIVIQLTVK